MQPGVARIGALEKAREHEVIGNDRRNVLEAVHREVDFALFQRLFELDGVELNFTVEALKTAAQQAMKLRTGARGLRTIIEQVLLDVMYEIPSLEGVRKCIVDANVIRNRTRPLLMTVNDRVLEYEKTA